MMTAAHVAGSAEILAALPVSSKRAVCARNRCVMAARSPQRAQVRRGAADARYERGPGIRDPRVPAAVARILPPYHEGGRD